MKVAKKLAQWRDAGVIDEDTLARIEAWERDNDRSGNVVLYAVGGVGAVAIVLGVVAIVAANWAAIPASFKLAVDLVLAATIAAAYSPVYPSSSMYFEPR